MKIRTLIFTFAALVFLQGSSPWEGAAATAPEGELPSTGFFVATNSFPKNTVVDITNIETNKSTRVIVANTLNSPGLLAIVSREAAELIGMRPGSISRIRMVQPSDPIAYLRFTESMSLNAPAYDSGSLVTEEQLLDELYSEDTYKPDVVAQPEIPSETPGISGPSYLLEPEWGGRGQSIIDLPGYSVTQTEPLPGQYTDNFSERTPFEDDPQNTAQLSQDEIVKDVSEKIEETPQREIVKEVSEYIADLSHVDIEGQERDEIIKDIPQFIAETPREEVVKAPDTEPVEQVAQTPQTQESEPSEYVMVPSENRPPEGLYGIDPSDIIPGINTTPSQPAVTAPVDTTTFSVPRIYQLDRGRYYVQVTAHNTPESVENAIRQIDRSYAPVVYKDGDNWYRVLLGGPEGLNQGESAAVLQRFKTIGYKDAFVRQGR